MRDYREETIDQLWELVGSEDAETKASALRELGHRKSRDRAFDEAEQLLTASRELLEALGEPADIGYCWYSLGHMYGYHNAHAQAETAFESAAHFYQQAGAFALQADAEFYTGYAQKSQRRYPQAFASFGRAIELYGDDMKEPLAQMHFYMGEMYEDRFELADAFDEYTEARELYIADGNPLLAAAAYLRLAFCRLGLGDYEGARQAAVETREACLFLGDNELPANDALAVQGSSLLAMGKYEVALAILSSASTAYKAMGYPLQAAEVDIERADCLIELDRLGDAQKIADEFASFATVVENHKLICRGMLTRGSIAKNWGEPALALEYFEGARNYAFENALSAELNDATLALIQELLDQNDLDAAESYLEACNGKIFGNVIGWLLRIKLAWGELFMKRGKFDEARTVFGEVEVLSEEHDIVIFREMAQGLLEQLNATAVGGGNTSRTGKRGGR